MPNFVPQLPGLSSQLIECYKWALVRQVEDGGDVVQNPIQRQLRRACISFSFRDEPLLTDPGFVLVDTPSSERRFRSRMYGMRSSGMIGLVYCEKAWVGTTRPVMIEEIHTID